MAALRMPQNIFEGVTRRTQHVMSLTDPSRTGEVAEFVLDVTEGLRACALLRDYLVQVMRLAWKQVFENTLEDDYNLAGRLYLVSFDAVLKTYEAVRKRAEQAQATAVEADSMAWFEEALAAFDLAFSEVRASREDFQKRWPWFKEDGLRQSLADERQGVRRRSVKEVHDELRRRLRQQG